MKHRKILIITIIICGISLAFNIRNCARNEHADRSRMDTIYMHLTNIDLLLSNLSTSSTEKEETYTRLHEESIVLDAVLGAYSTYQNGVSFQFSFNRLTNCAELDTLDKIAIMREKVRQLLIALSKNKQLLLSEYATVLPNPDYSLNIIDVFKLMNNILLYSDLH